MGEKNVSLKDDSVDNTVIGDQLDQFIDERIVLNVGGIKYETYRSTLTAHPKTFLGTMFHPRNQAMLHPVNGNEYFIDRNGHAFHYIMEYYRTGNIVWRPSPELPFENTTSNSSTTTISSINSVNNNGTHADHNNAIVPTGALAALSGIINNGSTSTPTQPSTSNNTNNNINNNINNQVLRRRHPCSHSSSPPIYPPYTSLPELEQEFSYFGIPFTSPLPIAQKAGGALLDEFTYSIEDLICTAIAKLIDRVSITFFRDGSPMECFLIQSMQAQCSNRSCSSINCSGYNRRCNNCNNCNGGGAKLIEFSLNGYCIVNHFYEDIRKYLETVFPNMVFRLEFGSNYKSITMSMSGLFTRNAIQKYSKIGKLSNNFEED
ncbi:hypothetical protein RclHR1_14110004 [Rhizophagus clarus]|uniref:BTB/POZ protein n=1 Tax=Rhizophagus clarus TaxID=94130 RepID=A0A2Z6QDL6_9GLOM|nr:hypothetical protein RclHR1_14110004 [Rhizophagus clarus]GES88894.1 BTB/POZ protein [Rhizophagus clarus]